MTGICVCWAARAAPAGFNQSGKHLRELSHHPYGPKRRVKSCGISKAPREGANSGPRAKASPPCPGWSSDCKQQPPPWLLAGELTVHLPLSVKFNAEETSCA